MKSKKIILSYQGEQKEWDSLRELKWLDAQFCRENPGFLKVTIGETILYVPEKRVVSLCASAFAWYEMGNVDTTPYAGIPFSPQSPWLKYPLQVRD